MDIKLGRMVTHLEGLPTIKSHSTLIMLVLQSHVTIKNHYISTNIVPMATKFYWLVTFLERLQPIKSHGLARSRDKQKPLYLRYQNTYDHQTWQVDNLPWEAPTNRVTRLFDHMVLQDHVTNKNHYIYTTRVFMATKLGRLITFLMGSYL